MARLWYGGTPADFVLGQGATTNILDDDGDATGDQMRYAGLPLESTTFTVYQDDMVTVDTDLQDIDGDPIEDVRSLVEYERRARIPYFQGSDGYEGDYYLSADGGSTFYRMPVSASTAFERLGVVEAELGGLSTSDLSDWSVEPPGHGDVATWDAGQGLWTSSTTGEISAEELDDLNDVETEGAGEGSTLALESDGIYRPAALPSQVSDLSDWSDDNPTDGYVPVWDSGEGEYVPTDLGEFTTGVQSVNGETGTVVLGADDVGAAPASHNHAASHITSGVIGVSRLPVGVGFNQVAAGDHTHNASSITAGTVNVNRLPVGTGSSEVAAGDHTHPRSDFVSISPTMGGNWRQEDNGFWVKNGIVFVQLDTVRDASGVSNTHIGFGTLPSGFRPPTLWWGVVNNRANGNSYSLGIEADGSMIASNVTVSTGHRLTGFAAFPLAN